MKKQIAFIANILGVQFSAAVGAAFLYVLPGEPVIGVGVFFAGAIATLAYVGQNNSEGSGK